ncbi:unnamed protein product [Dimorphilus gyrociliatus]|uniref:Uncharacterized protein n=1 Tax=Dimorphilus gyrociliatus TaxID=2664684 RepID=A0A7I8WFM6_9ANNE|nr:unnamed protein product [Dimorphilus gyrociliatus]
MKIVCVVFLLQTLLQILTRKSRFEVQMDYLFQIILLLQLVKDQKFEAVFKSCSQALIANDLLNSTFKIQPIDNGRKFDIKCYFSEKNEFISEIDNDVDQNKVLRAPLQSKKFITTNIKYQDMTNSELESILNLSGLCSQNMQLVAQNSQAKFLMFEFFDGTNYTLSNFEDGICKCLISKVCLENNDKGKVCTDTGTQIHNQVYNLKGEISVVPNRLPLIKTVYGDIDDPIEFAKHVINPLVCVSSVVKVSLPSGCFGNLLPLHDNDLSTCVTFKITSVTLEISFFKQFKIHSKLESLLSIVSYLKTEDSGIIRMCNEIEKHNFECEFYSRKILIFIQSLSESAIQLCEIEPY